MDLSSYFQYELDLGENSMAWPGWNTVTSTATSWTRTWTPHLKNDEVSLVNLRLTLTNKGNDWEVALWGRNLLDEKTTTPSVSTLPTVGGYTAVTAPELPRHYRARI